MKKTFFLIIAISVFSFVAQPALAARSADMFEDRGWATYNRPPVPSDNKHARNLIKDAPLLITVQEDMFGKVKPLPVSVRAEMLRSTRVAPSSSRLFRPWLHQ